MSKNLKLQKLKLYRKDYRSKQIWIWRCMAIALVVSLISSFCIAFYTASPWLLCGMCSTLLYAFLLLTNAFSLGYISGFTLYYLSEYRPKTIHLFEDIQKAIYTVNFIYEPARELESIIFKDSDVNSPNYVDEFLNKITESCESKTISVFDEVIRFIRMIDANIRFEEKNLYLIDNSIVTADLIKGVSMINISRNIADYNYINGIGNLKQVRKQDIEQAIKNFKIGISYIENYLKTWQKYSYVMRFENAS